MGPESILKILSIDQDYGLFCDMYRKYSSVRNCLTHRIELVSEDDDKNIIFEYPHLKYVMRHDGLEKEFENVDEMIRETASVRSERFIGIKMQPIQVEYSVGDRINISERILYGTAQYLYSQCFKIINSMLSLDIENEFDLHDPFKAKMKITYTFDG